MDNEELMSNLEIFLDRYELPIDRSQVYDDSANDAKRFIRDTSRLVNMESSHLKEYMKV